MLLTDIQAVYFNSLESSKLILVKCFRAADFKCCYEQICEIYRNTQK